MNIWITAVLCFVLGALAASLYFSLRRSGPNAPAARLAALDAQLHAEQTRLEECQQRLAAAEHTISQMSSQRERELRVQSERQAQQQGQEGRVLTALAPVAQNLAQLQQRLTALEQQRHQQFGNLSQQLDSAQQISRDLQRVTTSLEGALRSNSTRGAWGEAQLRNIVESAGLLENVDFLTQHSVTGPDATLRPDLVVKLPGGKSLPVDAKVPFDSYIRAQELSGATDPELVERRQQLLRDHVRAVRKHVDDLSRKDYGRWLEGSPDLTVAFLPTESLLGAALEADPTLLDYAFRQRVALTSPVSLWSVLKTISFAWQQDNLSAEATQVFDLARELHQRLGTLGKTVIKMGASLDSSVSAYNQFVGSLEGRVLVTARKLQKIDQDALIPQAKPIETQTRSPRAHELTDTEEDGTDATN